jgi:hypothetical protein
MPRSLLLCLAFWLASGQLFLAQKERRRILSGVVVTQKNEAVEGVSLTIVSSLQQQQTTSEHDGSFRSEIPDEPVTLKIGGKYIAPRELKLGLGDRTQNLKIAVEFVIPPIHESLVITATVLEPSIDRRDDVVYKSTLFSRDDQVFQTLDAGISLGQHEGGGKSLEVRRFGFNMDHGGVNGGLKVLVDNVQQNQATQRTRTGVLGTAEVADT